MPIQNPSDIKLNERYDVEALIGSPPGWTLRWGLTVMLAVLALLLWIAYLVRYPMWWRPGPCSRPPTHPSDWQREQVAN
jgi:hypothetical protein